MPEDDFNTKVNALEYIDPYLATEFKRLLETSLYHYETLYEIFMAHGDGAIKIIEYGIERNLSTWALLYISDQKMVVTKDISRLFETTDNKEDKLPKKLRNGWS